MRILSVLLSMVAWWILPFTMSHASQPLKVVVGIKPIHSLTTALMDGIAKPELLVDGSTIPYDYVLSVQKQKLVSNADLVIYSGASLEPSLASYLKTLDNPPKTFEILASDRIKVLPSRYKKDIPDPYFWLDVRNVELLINTISKRLGELDPQRVGEYEINRRKLSLKITRLERELEYKYRDVSWLSGYLYHDTQYYFEQSYGFRNDGILSPSPKGDGKLDNMLTMIAKLSEKPGVCLFTEAGLSKKNLFLIPETADINI
ncbi:MAG: zinc ABC transporter substrate-binding protein, partial [Magnetococcales bacterium]|nr:zinc ABC transporter substrate-binding protein [Magnetococcales bacterium]